MPTIPAETIHIEEVSVYFIPTFHKEFSVTGLTFHKLYCGVNADNEFTIVRHWLFDDKIKRSMDRSIF